REGGALEQRGPVLRHAQPRQRGHRPGGWLRGRRDRRGRRRGRGLRLLVTAEQHEREHGTERDRCDGDADDDRLAAGAAAFRLGHSSSSTAIRNGNGWGVALPSSPPGPPAGSASQRGAEAVVAAGTSVPRSSIVASARMRPGGYFVKPTASRSERTDAWSPNASSSSRAANAAGSGSASTVVA